MRSPGAVLRSLHESLASQGRDLLEALHCSFDTDYDRAVGILGRMRTVLESQKCITTAGSGLGALLSRLPPRWLSPGALEATFASFVADVTGMLERARPRSLEGLSDSEVREAVLYGILRAKSFKLETQSDVGSYVYLTFVLGRNFHSDPSLPWARRVLERPSRGQPDLRMAELMSLTPDGLGPPVTRLPDSPVPPFARLATRVPTEEA